MDWQDQGIVLGHRPHGENGRIVSLLTRSHGRHAGLAQGASKEGGLLQAGNLVAAEWRARLVDHLGAYTLEMDEAIPARWLDNHEVLAVIASATSMAEACLPERQSMEGVYEALCALLRLEEPSLWGPSYVGWEIGLLRSLGYGLHLDVCALTGTREDLAYVSPRTGRAVCRSAAKPYKEKLLRLPRFLTGGGDWSDSDLQDGLTLTGHFLERHVLGHNYGKGPESRVFPPARDLLVDFYRARS